MGNYSFSFCINHLTKWTTGNGLHYEGGRYWQVPLQCVDDPWVFLQIIQRSIILSNLGNQFKIDQTYLIKLNGTTRLKGDLLLVNPYRVYNDWYPVLQWRHNGRDSVSDRQPYDCLLNRVFRRRSKKTPKLRITGLYAGNSQGTGEFPTRMASNAENVSIWWRHHVFNYRHRWN